MTIRKNALIHKASIGFAGLALTLIAAGGGLLAADAQATNEPDEPHAAHNQDSPAKLVQLVRDATRQYINVNAATGAGYQPFLGCVSGQDHGAMGQHYVNLSYVADGQIDISRPEALIYESTPSGMQLLGVEFVVFADAWLKTHTAAPVLEGQTFLFVDSPNRFGLPAHFELHVWAWRANPQGAFVDWNNAVSCEKQ
jgi:hypothetical protein